MPPEANVRLLFPPENEPFPLFPLLLFLLPLIPNVVKSSKAEVDSFVSLNPSSTLLKKSL